MLKRSLVANSCPVKIGPKMAIFRTFKGLSINYSHWDPQKALSYPEQRLLSYDVFCVKIRPVV